jgi:hypothetical protein
MSSMEITEKYLDDFLIYGNPAHEVGSAIPIAIGNIRNVEVLTNENFGKICEIINRVTLTPFYPSGFSRSNHNGTHSARQARMMEALMNLFDRATKERLSQEETVHLKLAAYLLRSGRIDESSHDSLTPDNYYTRSAMIYEAYAKQLQVSEETVSWIYHVISNSCKPIGIRDKNIDTNPKWKFGWDCLAVVHETDLIRCFSKKEIDTKVKIKTEEHLKNYFSNAKTITEQLFNYSQKLCEATGCYRIYDDHPGNRSLFFLCSSYGKECWKRVQKIGLP